MKILYKNLKDHFDKNIQDPKDPNRQFLGHADLYNENLSRSRTKSGKIKLSRSKSLVVDPEICNQEFKDYAKGDDMSLTKADKEWIENTITNSIVAALREERKHTQQMINESLKTFAKTNNLKFDKTE